MTRHVKAALVAAVVLGYMALAWLWPIGAGLMVVAVMVYIIAYEMVS